MLRPEGHRDYAYLLGLYLGDGDISKVARSYRLRISLDSRYVAVVAEVAEAIRLVMPDRRVGIYKERGANLVRVSSYSSGWPLLLPQHGSGPKHTRTIELKPWQGKITARHHEAFLRGLIHSDGCRFVARQRSSSGRMLHYPRYTFRNKSRDIVELCCAHLDLAGVRWTLSSPETVQVARRAEVARLDAFVGPKR